MQDPLYLELHENELTHWWFVSRRTIVKKILDKFLSSTPDTQILEEGCGTGGNFELLKKYGNVAAFDSNPRALEFSSEHKGVEVKKGKIPDSIPFERKFDLICMIDVLEHLTDDAKALDETRKYLKADGKLLITVPAFNFLWCKQDVLKQHHRRYCLNMLIKLFQENNFQIVYSTYFNTFLFPVVLLIRLIYKIFNWEGISDSRKMPKLLNYVLKSVFSCEKIFFPWFSFPFGVSILILAEKSTINKKDDT